MNKKNKSDYLSSLKSIETENFLDRIFYRPIGYQIAKTIRNTGITPNVVTIVSIFIGISAGFFWWFPYDLTYAVFGCLALIVANILDCVDGQLARLTGIKSEVGRILDGFAGDLWFLALYIAFIHRLNTQFQTPYDPWIYILVVLVSAYSHFNQAAITDYYKTLHHFFISKEKGKEFENSQSVFKRYEKMKKGVNRIFTWGYVFYTKNQERQTPELQKMLARLKDKFGDELPEDVRIGFRAKSGRLMPLLNFNTFNGRSIILFISVIFNVLWLYFVWEIVVLNIVKFVVINRHEHTCKNFGKTLNP
ncbi:MAG: CDP-alcohol phosphatidyltransferase family protein [Paludibacteraceae bacterium]